jgi:hypothetical protein
MGYGVIGNTADSGSAILGSSPGTPAGFLQGLSRVFSTVFHRLSNYVGVCR